MWYGDGLGCMGMAMDVAMCVKIVSSFQVQEQSDQSIELKLNYNIYFVCANEAPRRLLYRIVNLALNTVLIP